jgi:ABC-type branched-subunit amino acid transport system substrate-binding protein
MRQSSKVVRFPIYLGIWFLIVISSGVLQAADYEAQFQKALEDYEAGHYQVAETEFKQLALSEIEHPKMSVSFLMWARALLKQHNYNQVLEVTAQLLAKFPESSYIDDAHYMRGEAYFDSGKPLECADELIWVITKGTDERLVERAKGHLKSLCQSMLSERERRELVAQVDNLAVQRIILGLEDTNLSEDGINIGVVLPLSGPDSDLGVDIKQGIEYAISQWKLKNDFPIGLTFYDSQGSAFEAARISNDILDFEQVGMILSAGEEGVVTACATQAVSKHVPCLVLNPQTYSFSSLGEEIFQLYPDRGTEGEALAEYAVRDLGLRTFAVMTPANRSGEEIARGFIETVNKLGGKVLVQEWFYPGSVNFEKQFVHIREHGLDMMTASTPDTTSISAMEAPIDSIWANMPNGEVLDTKVSIDDSVDLPVDAYDGFFIAANPGDVNILAPQYAFYNFSTQLLGSHDWDNQESFQKNRDYISGMVFTTDVYWDPLLLSNSEWMNEFRDSTGQSPNEVNIMGYDGMRWVLSAIDSLVEEGLISQNGETTPPLSPPTNVVGEVATPLLFPPTDSRGEKRLQGGGTLQHFRGTPPLSPPAIAGGEVLTPPYIPPAEQGGKWREDTLKNSEQDEVILSQELYDHTKIPEILLKRLQGQTEYHGIGGVYRFKDGMNTEVSMVRFDKGRKELLNP